MTRRQISGPPPGARKRTLSYVTSPDTKAVFDDLLLMLKETRGFDFTGYKPSTLQRRIYRRMAALDLSTFGEYRDYLELQPEEFTELFNGMLINVTSFFRDPAAWQVLSGKVVPELLSAKGPQAPIRVWSAGCATGEEAYTLAMILTEALGPDQFRARVKIYATDLDEDALQQARYGVYDARALGDVPEGLRETYFELGGDKCTFRRDLRRQVIFGRNDLTRNAPISRVDLLVSRNTLMYFNAETQADVLRRFHFALSDPGYLFLGKAEMLLNHSDHFQPVDLRKRIFRKLPSSRRLPGEPGLWAEPAGPELAVGRLKAAALASVPVAQLAIDLLGNLGVANATAEALFSLRPRDVGRPFQDLEVSFRPVELRSPIEQARTDMRQIELRDVEWQRVGSGPRYYDVTVAPLFGTPGDLVGVGISFIDVTRDLRMREDLEHAHAELERAHEELHSLNEELETTNEELQSTNDELQEINEELRQRTEEVHRTNNFLGSIFRSLGNAVIVLTEELCVKVWSPGAEEMWGLRADETVGKSLLALDIGLPTEVVTPHLRRVLNQAGAGSPALELTAVNRRGKTVNLRIAATPLRTEEGATSGFILVIDHVPTDAPQAEQQIPR